MTNDKGRKIIGWIIAAVYMVILLKLTVVRHDFLMWPLFSHGSLNLIPFAFYLKTALRHRYYIFIYNFIGNIVWFMPFGFLLRWLTGRPNTVTGAAAAGFLFSFGIEFAQFAFGTGESELDDLILNTLGAVLGYLLFRYLGRRKNT